ncbi:MAG: hypothetical protein CMH35_10285, partial [Microbacterium sp.]|nr:hypothetical protein [Microbacterium sp.]
MPRRPEPIDPRLGVAFSVAEARRMGVSARRLRGRDLEMPFIGARMRTTGAADIASETATPGAAAARRRRQDTARRAAAYNTV